MPSLLQAQYYNTIGHKEGPGCNDKLKLPCAILSNVAVTGHILPQALHNVLHVVSVNVMPFKQAAIAGPLHGELQIKHSKRHKSINIFF